MTAAASRLLDWIVPAGLLAAGLLLALLVRLPGGALAVLWMSWLAAWALWLRQGGGGVVAPVLVYDMVRQTRRARFFLVRLTYLLILFAVLGWTYWMWSLDRDVGRLPASELPAFAESFFSTYLVVQFLMVLVLTPAVTAGAIAEEKERQTLPFLLATDLSNREIVLGKLASRFSFLVLALISGLPVLALLQLIGGVDPAWLLATFAGTLATAVSLAGVGVFWSTYLRRTRDATIVAYLTLPVYVLLGYGALGRSEEHTSELQSLRHLVCRLLL